MFKLIFLGEEGKNKNNNEESADPRKRPTTSHETSINSTGKLLVNFCLNLYMSRLSVINENIFDFVEWIFIKFDVIYLKKPSYQTIFK